MRQKEPKPIHPLLLTIADRLVQTGANAVDNVGTGDTRLRKMLIDGQLLILREGKMYNVQGQEMK